MKNLYLILFVAGIVFTCAGAIIDAIGWNAKSFSYLIHDDYAGMFAGVCVSLLSAYVFYTLPEYKRQKKVVAFYVCIFFGAVSVVGNGVLSVEAIKISNQNILLDSKSTVDSDPVLLVMQAQIRNAQADVDRVQGLLEEFPVSKKVLNNAMAYRDSLVSQYRMYRDSAVVQSESARPKRPVTDYVGGLLLILVYQLTSVSSNVWLHRFRVEKKKQERLNTLHVQDDDKQCGKSGVSWLARISAADGDDARIREVFSEMVSLGEFDKDVYDLLRKSGHSRQKLHNWKKRVNGKES